MHQWRAHARKSFGPALRSVKRAPGYYLGLALALAGLMTGPVIATAQLPAPQAVVFDGVTVIDVEHGIRVPAQRVVIVGNRITAVGSARKIRIPVGARVVGAAGKYVIPGLWDMHIHPDRYPDLFFPMLIANGVTGIRVPGSSVPLDTQRLWRREVVSGSRVGPPRQFLGGPMINELPKCVRGKGKSEVGEGQTCVSSDPADARHLVDSLAAAGADFIKTYTLGSKMYFAIAAEARRIGIPFGGHLSSVGAIEASDSGAGIVDHLRFAGVDMFCLDKLYPEWIAPNHVDNDEFVSLKGCGQVAERFRHNGTWWVPTIMVNAVPAMLNDVAGGAYKSPMTRALMTRFETVVHAFWAGALPHGNWLHDPAGRMPKAMPKARVVGRDTASSASGFLHLVRQAGLPVLAGTDAMEREIVAMPPGFSVQTELAIYVAEGFTPAEALQTATLNPAKVLHATDSLGTIAPGKLADLVLLDADPLEDITNTTTVRAVVANGRYFDRVALDRLLKDVQTRAKREPQPLGKSR